MRRRREWHLEEWLEQPGHPPENIAENLDDMERLLRWLGVGRRVAGYLRGIEHEVGKPLRVLDLATGSGWLPRTLATLGAREGSPVEAVGVDRDPRVVAVARERATAVAGVRIETGDMAELGLSPGAFDVVTCTMALHHLDDASATAVLETMDEIAGRGWILCDLVRSSAAYWATRLCTRMLTSNPLSLNDGPLSVRRAFTVGELRALIGESKVPNASVQRFSGICVAVWRDPGRK